MAATLQVHVASEPLVNLTTRSRFMNPQVCVCRFSIFWTAKNTNQKHLKQPSSLLKVSSSPQVDALLPRDWRGSLFHNHEIQNHDIGASVCWWNVCVSRWPGKPGHRGEAGAVWHSGEWRMLGESGSQSGSWDPQHSIQVEPLPR